jgi:glycosyltransferase involved in cell wall biosynthesis
MYPPHHLGGYELLWSSAVRSLVENGHSVRVLTTDYRVPGVTAAEEGDVHRQLRWWWHEHAFPRRSPAQRLRLERDNARIWRSHLGQFRPDVVAWWSMGGMSLSLLAHAGRAGLPAVAFLQDDWLVYGPEVDQWLRMFAGRARLAAVVERTIGIPTRLALGAVRRWLFASAYSRARALEVAAGLSPDRCGIAPSGIDPRYLEHPVESPWAWRLLYVGRIDERKGIADAIEAVALLPPQAALTVVGRGDGQHLHDLQERVGRLGLRERVTFRGARPREELIGIYDEHDALLFPSRWEEPWGLVPLEAMARRRPVVATGTGGSSEYLRDGHNCLLFSPADVHGLADAVRRVADPSLRARLLDAGRQTAARHTEAHFNHTVEEELTAAASPSASPASPRPGAPSH